MTEHYSVDGYEDQFSIERKSPNDFQQCMTRERDRFERELARLHEMDYAAVLVECELQLRRHAARFLPGSLLYVMAAWTGFRRGGP